MNDRLARRQHGSPYGIECILADIQHTVESVPHGHDPQILHQFACQVRIRAEDGGDLTATRPDDTHHQYTPTEGEQESRVAGLAHAVEFPGSPVLAEQLGSLKAFPRQRACFASRRMQMAGKPWQKRWR